jgi:prolyl oligopeptidase
MRQQDAVARAYLAKLPGRELLHDRLRALSYIDMVNPPIHRGTRYFYSRQHAHKEKVVWYWREGEDGKPRVLIDPNTLSDDGSISLRGLSISWDGRSVAYKLSQNAADQATLYVMEVATGKTSKVDVIKGARYAHASWTPDGEGFYYTRLPVDPAIPAAELPGHAAVYFHRLGSDPTRDRLIHPATGDPRKFIGVDLSRDGRYLFLYVLHGWTKTDLYLKKIQRRGRRAGYPPRGKKTVSFAPLAVGLPAHFSVEAWKRWLYVHTDHEAPRYRLCRVHPDRLQRSAWEEIVPERKDAVLEGFSIVGGHLALRYLKDATTRLEIARLDGTPRREIAFPGLGTASGLRGNPDEDTAYYSYSSFTTPDTVYRTSVRDGGRDVYSEPLPRRAGALPLPRRHADQHVHRAPSRHAPRRIDPVPPDRLRGVQHQHHASLQGGMVCVARAGRRRGDPEPPGRWGVRRGVAPCRDAHP